MADITGDGSGTIGGITSSSSGRVEWYTVTAVYPIDSQAIPLLLVPLILTRESWNGASGDVDIQVSDTEDFSSLIVDLTASSVAGDNVTKTTVNASGLVDEHTYWWRMRPVYPGDYEADWVGPWLFSTWLLVGDTKEYVDLNVGVEVTPEDFTPEYVNINTGVEVTLYAGVWEYQYINVGVAITLASLGHDYAHYGDVDESTPTPHIWFLRPTAGRPFDGIDIIGLGFGDLQEEYGAIPQILIEVWEALAIADWQSYPPSVNAYELTRVINSITSEIDPQHQIISVIIPAGAHPPGHPVRVRIED